MAAAAPLTAYTPKTSTRHRPGGPRQSPRPAHARRAVPPPPHPPARHRLPRHRSCAWSRPYSPSRMLDDSGDDRLRRGRFVGSVASRGTGGLVKPRQTINADKNTAAVADEAHGFALVA